MNGLSFTDWVISAEIRVVITRAGDCGIFGTNEWVHSTTIKATRMTLIRKPVILAETGNLL